VHQTHSEATAPAASRKGSSGATAWVLGAVLQASRARVRTSSVEKGHTTYASKNIR
jgi:hypothetical protein